MKTPTIFGREPAVIVGLIQAALAFAVSFGWLAWIGIAGQAELGLAMAVVIAVGDLYVAYVTRAALLGVAIGLFKALAAFAVIYNFQLTADQTATIIAAITAGLGFFQRTQTEPVPKSQHSLDLAA